MNKPKYDNYGRLRLFRFRTVSFCILLTVSLIGAVEPTIGQQRRVTEKSQKSLKRAKLPEPNSVTAGSSTKSPENVSPPVSLVNQTVTDFLSGEASVTVNPKQPTVIRLGLAQNAVSIVEFPVADSIYYIHEGNPKMASVFQSPTKETDKSITIYPGETFLPSRDGITTAASISIQMKSGLVLILELVPVSDLRKNAHRCVINYDREAVVTARRAAGLAYDLGEQVNVTTPMNSRAVSKLMLTAVPNIADKNNETLRPISELVTNTPQIEITNAKRSRDKKISERKMTEEEISTLANKKLAESLRNPKKTFPSWTKPQAGIELAVSPITEIDSELRLVVVAIRNVTTWNLRLVPGSPELQVHTTDGSGNSLQTARLEAAYIETTSNEGLVQPGSTVYYALVYRTPILGANQSIRVLAAHRDAADEMITVSLSGRAKGKE